MLFSSLNVSLPFVFSVISAYVVILGKWHKFNASVEDAGMLNASTAWEWVQGSCLPTVCSSHCSIAWKGSGSP